jgi:hypothetical protein
MTPGRAHEVVEERSAGLVGRNHLPIKNDALDVELGCQVSTELGEAGQIRALPLRESKRPLPLLEVEQSRKPVVSEAVFGTSAGQRTYTMRARDSSHLGKSFFRDERAGIAGLRPGLGHGACVKSGGDRGGDASKVMALDEDDVAEMMSATGWPLAKMCLVMALPSTL